jgi:hypothetical protein
MNEIIPALGIPVPLVLTCTKTGKVMKYTDPAYIKSRIDKAGSLQNLLDTYVSRGSGSKEAEGQPKEKHRPTIVTTRHLEDGRVHHEFIFSDDSTCNVYAPAPQKPSE